MTHLLVVDDEVSILELIKNSLGKDGYLITVCQNADDVDIKKLHFYDLILLDVMMPGTDGFEFCKQIRNMVDCPILFLTAKTLEEDILFGLGIGADDYITKPFRIQELRARVAAHLRREKREHHSTLSFEPDISFDLSAKVLPCDITGIIVVQTCIGITNIKAATEVFPLCRNDDNPNRWVSDCFSHC